MCVGSLGRLVAGLRDRLINLGAADTRDEDAIRAVNKDQAHRGISRLEQRASCVSSQLLDELRVEHPHAAIDLQRIDTEIEQDRAAVLLAECLRVGAHFGQGGTAIHGGLPGRQQERYALAPGLRRHRFKRVGTDFGMRQKPDASPRRHNRNRRLAAREFGWFAHIAREFRNCAERAETPLRLRIVKLSGNQVESAGQLVLPPPNRQDSGRIEISIL